MARTKPWTVSDEFWEKVEPLVPPAPSHAKGDRTRMDDRKAFAAIVYVLRTGIQWNALLRELGASSTVHDRFQEWERAGFFEELWGARLAEERRGDRDCATTEMRLREILAGVDQDLVVCGHTHAQFDRRVGGKRVVNAGSVGMPYQGKPVGAFWLLLEVGGVSVRRSDYDLDRTVGQIRATGYPDAEYMAEILLEAPDPERVAALFEQRAAGD